MTALYVIGGIVFFIVLLCLLPVGVRIRYDGAFGLCVTVGPVKKQILPKKKKKIKLSDYSEKKLERQRKKLAKKASKKKKKPQSGVGKPAEKKDSVLMARLKSIDTAPDMIAELYGMLCILVEKFAKRLHIKVFRLFAVIGSDNAAKTAILYGGACSAAGMICTLLNQHADLKKVKDGINVTPDFLSEKTTVDADVSVKIYVGGLFTYLFEIRGVIKQILHLLEEEGSNG